MPHPAPIRPSIALAAFAEKFIDGRRVVVFGNALSPLWEQLIERGARLVHVCDADTTRVSEAAARNTSQHVSFAPLAGSGLAVRDGAFDVGLIENLSTYSEPATPLHRMRRALAPRGVALIAAPNPDVDEALIAGSTDGGRTLDYYSLYDCVHREFPVVRMAGQMPFVGYSVAELAPAEEPEPCIDAGFVPGGTEEPEWFVAIASQSDVQFESFVIVQLPYDYLARNGSERILRDQLRAARAAERSAVERLSRIEAEQRRLTEATQRHQKDVDLARQIRLLQEELERKESWILQLEARAATADARADEADQELDDLRQRLDSTKHEPAQLGSSEDWRKTVERIESEKCDLFARLSVTENEAKELEQRTQLQQSTLAEALKRAEESQRNAEERLSEALNRTEENLKSTEGRLSAALRRAEENLKHTQDRLTAEREEAAARLHAAETQRQEAESSLALARRQIEDFTLAANNQENANASDVQALEAQLRDRGERIRQLEADLKRTEAVGARAVRELARLRMTLAESARETAGVGVTPTINNELWAQGSPTASTAASTQQSVDQASAWAQPPAATGAEEQAMREKLDHLAGLMAKQEADLVAYQWRVQQLVDERTALDQLSEELGQAKADLQRNAVVFAQLTALQNR
ncbi:MAG: hypothetical protein ACM3ZE_03960 [Myxococcales bacterium]